MGNSKAKTTTVTNYSISQSFNANRVLQNRISLCELDSLAPFAILQFDPTRKRSAIEVMINGVFKVHLPEAHYQWAIDLLRNEKPVKAYIREKTPYYALFTGPEPVGEEEDA